MSYAVPPKFLYDQARLSPTTLSDNPGGNVAFSAANFDYFLLVGDGLTSTRQLLNPTGLVAGERRVIAVEWEHAGTDTLTFDTLFEFGDPGAPAYPAAGVRDLIYMTWNGSILLCSYVQGYAT